ncbi:MAG: OmpA family protein [Vicingaceae bacterium]|nr:OmpA family protein [Vicingaceae bacterium]
MKVLIIYFSFIVLLFLSIKSIAQETFQRDCIHPQEIYLSEIKENFLAEEIYYQEDDAYTFWYKITSHISLQINYELKSIEPNDNYEILVYSYVGNDFCNDLVEKEIQSIKMNEKGVFDIEKNKILYVSILHINGKGCGHELILSNKNLAVSFKAIQNTCVEEVAEEIINQEIKKDNIELVENKVVEVPTFISENEKIESENLLKGKVINNETKQFIDAEITIVSLKKNTKSTLFSSKNNGFELAISNNNSLIIQIEKFGYKAYMDTITDFKNPITIPLNPMRVGEKIVMHKIYFHPNTAVLKETSKNELEKLANFVKENKNYKIEIQGHTNGNRKIKKDKKYSHLGDEWNFSGSAKELSQLRAEKIKTFLAENGGNENNIIAKGYGGDKMIINNPKNMKEAMQNIRVEIVVIEKGNEQ